MIFPYPTFSGTDPDFDLEILPSQVRCNFNANDVVVCLIQVNHSVFELQHGYRKHVLVEPGEICLVVDRQHVLTARGELKMLETPTLNHTFELFMQDETDLENLIYANKDENYWEK